MLAEGSSLPTSLLLRPWATPSVEAVGPCAPGAALSGPLPLSGVRFLEGEDGIPSCCAVCIGNGFQYFLNLEMRFTFAESQISLISSCPTALLTYLFFFIKRFIFSRFSSVQFSRSVAFSSFRPHEPQHARPPCPSPTPGVHSNSCPLSQ